MKIYLICLIVLCCLSSLLAQSCPDTLWTRTIESLDSASVRTLLKTADGGYLLAGSVDEQSGKRGSVYFQCLSAEDGQSRKSSMESRLSSGGRESGCNQHRPAASRRFLYRALGRTGYRDFGNLYLLKIKASGDTAWTRKHEIKADEFGDDLKVMPDGGFMIAAKSEILEAVSIFCEPTKTDISCINILIPDLTESTMPAGGDCVYLLENGEFLMTKNDSNRVQVLCCDSLGIPRWATRVDNVLKTYNPVLIQTNDNGMGRWGAMIGDPGIGNSGQMLVHLSSKGEVLWSCQYNSTYSNRIYLLEQTSDSGFIMITSQRGYQMMKTDRQGYKLRNCTYKIRFNANIFGADNDAFMIVSGKELMKYGKH